MVNTTTYCPQDQCCTNQPVYNLHCNPAPTPYITPFNTRSQRLSWDDKVNFIAEKVIKSIEKFNESIGHEQAKELKSNLETCCEKVQKLKKDFPNHLSELHNIGCCLRELIHSVDTMNTTRTYYAIAIYKGKNTYSDASRFVFDKWISLSQYISSLYSSVTSTLPWRKAS
jgi:hypothetical protein